MATPNDQSVREVRYTPTAAQPFEILSIAELQRRVTTEQLAQHEQIDFELVIVCTRGQGRHEVDFVEVPLVPQRVIRVRTGQVHRWFLDDGYDGLVVLFEEPTSHRLPWSQQPAASDLSQDEWADLQPILQLLTHQRRSGPALDHELWAQRTLLLSGLGLDPTTARNATPQEVLHTDFRRALDADRDHSRSVTHYARQLGCSTRTLTRACQATTGSTAKQILDDRIVLQARRLLSLPNRTAAAVGSELGFSEATNFVKFFKRHTGQTPTQWHDAQRGSLFA